MNEQHLSALIVDDDDVVLRLLENALRDVGISDVVSATDGMEAKGIVEKGNTRFAVVVSDLMMPKMDGLEFLEYFRSVDQDTPFVMLTMVSDIEDHTKAKSLGATHFFTKPLSFEDITARLRTIMLSEFANSR